MGQVVELVSLEQKVRVTCSAQSMPVILSYITLPTSLHNWATIEASLGHLCSVENVLYMCN